MKQTYVGTWPIGHENCQLYAMPDSTGGDFYGCPDSNSCARIKVGLDYRCFDEVIAVLIHEAMEFALMRSDCRYQISGKLNRDHADYLFCMTHEQFGRACSKVAMFMSEAVPKLSTLWQRQHRRKRR